MGGQAILLHRRLSILDLSSSGWQPMGTPDGRYQIVFNGEIYNYLELREELGKLGHSFHTGSDTEVLLAAWACWGRGALRRLEGMFAYAILDTREGTVVLVRDPFGIKPLYIAQWDGCVVFASEMKTILALPGFKRRADPQSLCDYLRYGLSDHGERTMFAGIHELRPGCILEVKLGAAPSLGSSEPYWTPKLEAPISIPFNEAAGKLRGLFLDSVRVHLRSDVPVGAALSGGIDSSAIVMAMRELEPELDLRTFTYVANAAKLDESGWAGLISTAASARAYEVRFGASDFARDLDALLRVQDAPFLSPSIYAQNRVCGLAASAGIKVMLNGQGADELFGGYSIHLLARLAAMVRTGRLVPAIRMMRQMSCLPGFGRKIMAASQFLLPGPLQDGIRGLVGEGRWQPWLDRTWFERRGAVPSRRQVGPSHPEILKQLLLTMLEETTLPMLLRYEDRNSMSYGIETRVPFLTTRLTEFIYSLPESYLVSDGGKTKSVFRAAMRGIVPDSILDRKDKIGFETPGQPWIDALRPWIDGVLRSDTARGLPVLKHQNLLDDWSAMLDGSRPLSDQIWRWLGFIRWVEVLGVEVV